MQTLPGEIPMKTLKVDAKVNNLSKVLDFINDELSEAGCSIRDAMQIDVAVEELFVNIALYAYPSGSGIATICISILNDPKTAEISLSDSGIPFDPLAKEDPDISLNADEREIGGLGIYMARKTMDEITYENSDGLNITTIRKKI